MISGKRAATDLAACELPTGRTGTRREVSRSDVRWKFIAPCVVALVLLAAFPGPIGAAGAVLAVLVGQVWWRHDNPRIERAETAITLVRPQTAKLASDFTPQRRRAILESCPSTETEVAVKTGFGRLDELCADLHAVPAGDRNDSRFAEINKLTVRLIEIQQANDRLARRKASALAAATAAASHAPTVTDSILDALEAAMEADKWRAKQP